MFSHRICSRGFGTVPAIAVLVSCTLLVPTVASDGTGQVPSQSEQSGSRAAAHLKFVREFSSAEDVKHEHLILNRALDIVAGPADPVTRVDTLHTPVAVATDSTHRAIVADTGSSTVHVFDFVHARYSRLDASGERLHDPVALAVDAHDNVYVVDQISRTVFVYDAAGKFRRAFGKLRGGESYFESPTGIAIDRSTGRVYVCDRLGHMVIVLDQRGKVLRKIGKRGGGEGPADFRLPTQVVVSANEILVLDAGNKRIQVLDPNGRFLRAINVGYAGHGAGLAADTHGNIYLSDPSLDQIQVFGRDGGMLYSLDPSTIKGANFRDPAGMWIEEGRSLYVVDSRNNRVAQFEIR